MQNYRAHPLWSCPKPFPSEFSINKRGKLPRYKEPGTDVECDACQRPRAKPRLQHVLLSCHTRTQSPGEEGWPTSWDSISMRVKHPDQAPRLCACQPELLQTCRQGALPCAQSRRQPSKSLRKTEKWICKLSPRGPTSAGVWRPSIPNQREGKPSHRRRASAAGGEKGRPLPRSRGLLHCGGVWRKVDRALGI